jgi:hypothetical protein
MLSDPTRCFICATLLALAMTRYAEGGAAAVAVRRSSAAVTLDGRLDEPAWGDAPVMRLVQQSPRPGEPTPYGTEVRVILSGDALYFGFLCRDPEPNKIAVHTMRRDGLAQEDEGMTRGDDTVSIAIDPYGDKRTGYFFALNAAGARSDGLIAGPEHPSFDWDGIWDARARRTAEGWSAEIEVPARTLSFTPGLDEWGLNLERSVARERITLRWAAPTLDAFFFDLSRAGSLSGVGELSQGLGIEVSPYVVGRTKQLFGQSPRAWQSSGGVDFTWKITPQLVMVFTGNTDFAETEVDARQINITRFPLFFPEKRAFFLEGANQYEFGLGVGEQFIPFFSRRIGLLEGQQIPINAGVKLNGRVGRWNLALLDVQTRETQTSTGMVPSTNLLAGRISYEVTSKLRVGTIFTHGDPEGRRSNTLAGVDAVWRTSTFRGDKNLLVGGWTALTAGDREPGRRSGWGFKVDYPNDLWDCMLAINDFGQALDPALGFLPRRGVRETETGCSFKPRPSRDGRLRWIRQQFFEGRLYRVTNHRGFTESWQYFVAPLKAQLESGDAFEFDWQPEYEFLAAPFEIVPGVVIPPGGYRFNRWQVEVESSSHRPVQAGAETWFGTFYTGTLTQWQHYVRWTSPKGRIQLGVTAENNFGHLPQGNFVQRLWQFQSAMAWNPNLVLTSLVQYDTESQNLGANTRLRWTIKPGNDLFVVWNRGWQRLILRPQELSLIPDNELLAVKLRWTFRR